GSRFESALRATDGNETNESRHRGRDSARSRIARAKIDCGHGCTKTGADYEGWHRHEGRVEIDVDEPAFAQLRRGKPALLAKRPTNSNCTRRTDRRIDWRELSGAKRARYGKLGLVEWCGRSHERNIGKQRGVASRNLASARSARRGATAVNSSEKRNRIIKTDSNGDT